MTVRQTVVAPLGLITTPNPYGQYPAGALSAADGCSMRAPGELRSLPTLASGVFVHFAGRMRKLMPLDAGHVYAFTSDAGGTSWLVWEGAGSATSATLPSFASTTGLFMAGRICPVRVRDRMLVNSTQGVMVGDVMAPTTGPQRALRWAGMPQPSVTITEESFGNGPIPINTMVAYCAVLVREFADGYRVVSVPSVAQSWWAQSSTRFQAVISWGGGSIIAGDSVELYRTDGLQTTTGFTDPGTTFKLVWSHALSSAEAAALSITVLDNAACDAPFYTTAGRALYTNPGQEGALGANRQPDICGAAAVFKGYTFYGNLTERPQLVLASPSGFRLTDATSSSVVRANHVGYRKGAGTRTSGSPTITAIPAGQNAGVVAGQQCQTIGFPGGTTVLSTTATSITFSANATSSSTTDGWVTLDVLEVDGVRYPLNGYSSFAFGFTGYEVTLSATANTYIDPLTAFNAGESATVEPWLPVTSTITARATNGANYSPALPEINQTVQTFTSKTTPNLMRWSKNNEPEHVPASNETRVGAGTIIQFVSTKDALWIFCTDGVFRLAGDAGVWRIDVIDPKCVLCAPQCATTLHETVYAYTNYGFVSITASGIKPISLNRVTELLPGSAFAELGDMIVERDPQNHEVLISLSSTSNIIYIYNTPNDAFTRVGSISNTSALAFQEKPASGAAVVLVGASDGVGWATYSAWNNMSSWLPMSISYRSFYGDDPLSQKQWISLTWLFADTDAGKTAVNYLNSNNVYSGTSVIRQSFNDGYATMGVARDASIAPSIAPYLAIDFTTTQTRMRGVSFYLCEYTQQPWRQQ